MKCNSLTPGTLSQFYNLYVSNSYTNTFILPFNISLYIFINYIVKYVITI